MCYQLTPLYHTNVILYMDIQKEFIIQELNYLRDGLVTDVTVFKINYGFQNKLNKTTSDK